MPQQKQGKVELEKVRVEDLSKKMATKVPVPAQGVTFKYHYPEMPNYRNSKIELKDNESMFESSSDGGSEASDSVMWSNEDFINKKRRKMGALYSNIFSNNANVGKNKQEKPAYHNLVDELLSLQASSHNSSVDDDRLSKGSRLPACADYALSDEDSQAQISPSVCFEEPKDLPEWYAFFAQISLKSADYEQEWEMPEPAKLSKK